MRNSDAIRAQVLLDLLVQKSGWPAIVGIGVVMPLGLALLTGNLNVATPIVVAIGISMTIAAFTQDHASNLNRLYAALPITRHQFINARYLLQLGYIALQLLVLVAAVALSRPDTGEVWALPLLFTSLNMIISAIFTPLIIRFGTQHMMLFAAGVIGLGALVGFFIARLGSQAISTLLEHMPTLGAITGGLVIFALLLMEISRRISQRLYAAKDF